jgi:hypothetical protein
MVAGSLFPTKSYICSSNSSLKIENFKRGPNVKTGTASTGD